MMAAFSSSGNGKPNRPRTTGGGSLAIPDVARPPSIIPHSILRTPFAGSIAHLAQTGSYGPDSPAPPGAEDRSASGRSKNYSRVTPSRAAPRAAQHHQSRQIKYKRQASSSSDEKATCSNSTVVGSESGRNSNTSFTLVEGINEH
ncbi:hypothetical protein EVAR_41894_1 [Eumeta japonica]|uniref:Uncharacterized protein n=1 Tax=Eumeta variegata TaxID=151549 RepID=A0A4C1YIA3_EUMVA|nr:hypothetical protein EVAR_41894_1 [Eumeta japonica]